MTSAPVNDVVITLDTDWVPGFVIDDVLEKLEAWNIPATVFFTNEYSGTLPDCIEAGVHPNFFPGSTQGSDKKEVITYLKELFPDAVSVRTHRMYWESNLIQLFLDSGFLYDSSMTLPFHPNLQPTKDKGLIRFPCWWSDNFHIAEKIPFALEALTEKLAQPGLKVLNFHFSHVWMNLQTPEDWNSVRSGVSNGLQYAQPETLEKFKKKGPGIGTLFSQLLLMISKQEIIASNFKELVKEETEI